jgi:Icc-related predicted phosphoesterase
MKILLASDLHSLPRAFEAFAETLKRYDAGIIAGDIVDEYVPDEQLIQMLGLHPDDFLDELPAPDETADDIVKRWKESEQSEYLRRGLIIKEQEAKDIFNKAGKPVLIVPGNHDVTDWKTDRNVINIHLKRFILDGIPVVGYGCLDGGLEPELQMRLLNKVRRLVDCTTVFVTHMPPYSFRDFDDYQVSFGSKKLAEFIATRRPLYHVFGHAHSAAGVQGNSINACYPETRAFFGLDTETGEVRVERDPSRPRPIWVQEADDAKDAEELVDVETLERNQMREERTKDMLARGSWYHDDGRPVDGRRFIALGRHEYYKAFAHRLSEQLGTEVYLLDYMIWLDLEDPHGSLLCFIKAAERIDINLQGISKEDLRRATVEAVRLALDRRDLGLPYMTSWEINQVYWGGHLHKAWWHSGESMSKQEAHEAMGEKVSFDRIVEDSL